jgi:hypothetical protein
MPRQYDDDYVTARRPITPGGPAKVEYSYADGSSETHTVSKKGPTPPSKYISKNQDGEVPEGVKITAKPRASGALRRTFIQHLGTAYADEYITKEEFDARHAEADKALTDAELRVLIADLPSLPAPKQQDKPKLTWKKIKTDLHKTVGSFWESGLGIFTKFALFTISYIGGLTIGVLPSVVLLAGVKHGTSLHQGIAAVTIIAGVVWTVANIVGTIYVVEHSS